MSAKKKASATPRKKGVKSAAASEVHETPEAEGALSAAASGKVRINLRIDAEDYVRLIVHCAKAEPRLQPGEMIGELIRTHLRKYRVQENPGSKAEDSRDQRNPAHDRESTGGTNPVESTGKPPVPELPAAPEGAVRSKAA